MIRTTGLLLCLILAGAQDPADKVKALVEKLGSDDIAEREKAGSDLVKMGPAALPALREHSSKIEGERRRQIQGIIARIERDDRLAKLVAPGPTITLKAKDKPAKEVLAELQRQAGIHIDGSDLPAGTLLSLDSGGLSFPRAVDEMCRVHGRVMYEWSPSLVRIRPVPYRKLPAFDAGPFRFIVDGLLWTIDKDNNDWFWLKGIVVGPPGRLPTGIRIEIEEGQDDEGTDLGKTGPRKESDYGDLVWVAPNPAEPFLARPVFRRLEQSPSVKAAKLDKIRGKVRLTFILEGKRVASVKSVEPGEATEDERVSLQIQNCRLDAGKLRLTYALDRVEEDESDDPPKPQWIAVHDAGGRRLDGHESVDSRYGYSSSRGNTNRTEGTLLFQVPAGFVPATVDLMELADSHEILIPFELEGVALR